MDKRDLQVELAHQARKCLDRAEGLLPKIDVSVLFKGKRRSWTDPYDPVYRWCAWLNERRSTLEPAVAKDVVSAQALLLEADGLLWKLALTEPGVAFKVANKQGGTEDSVQVARIGLYQAARRFDPELGNGFNTFGKWWALAWVSREKNPERHASSISHGGIEIFRNYRRLVLELEQHGRKMSRSGMAAALGTNLERLDAILLAAELSMSLDGDGSDFSSPEETTADPSQKPPDEISIESEEGQRVLDLVRTVLTHREQEILKRTYGLFDADEATTLNDIGKHLGLSRERVRQLRQGALLKLKAAIERDEWYRPEEEVITVSATTLRTRKLPEYTPPKPRVRPRLEVSLERQRARRSTTKSLPAPAASEVTETTISVAGCAFSPETGRWERDGVTGALQMSIVRTLMKLVEHRGEVVSKFDFEQPKSIAPHVCHLRKILGHSTIELVRGSHGRPVGYRLVGDEDLAPQSPVISESRHESTSLVQFQAPTVRAEVVTTRPFEMSVVSSADRFLLDALEVVESEIEGLDEQIRGLQRRRLDLETKAERIRATFDLSEHRSTAVIR